MNWYRRNILDRRSCRPFVPVLLALFVIWLPLALQARQDASSPQLPPGVEIKVQAHPLKATVGDPIQIDLDFALPRGYQLEFPHLPAQAGEFTVLETFPGPNVPPSQPPGKPAPPAVSPGVQRSDVLHHQARIVVAVYKPGEFDFPGLPFLLRDGAGKEVQVSSPAVRISIESVLADTDLSLRDLKKQAEIEEPARWIWWLALGIPALILALLLVRWWRKRRRHPAFSPAVYADVDPLDLAEAELRDLIGRGLPEKGLIKQLYVDLSEIMKKVLEATYGIPTVEKTTAEIAGALASTPGAIAEPANLERIETLLLSCDLVKFARYIPSCAENEEAAKEAFQILADCRARRQPVVSGVAPVAGVS